MFSTVVAPELVRERIVAGDVAWTIVDCRYSLSDPAAGRNAYEAAHLPRAHFIDLDRDLTGTPTGTNGRHPLPDPDAFALVLRSIGVRAQTQLVAYDAGGDMSAARFWFLCRWIGHRAVAVLDGGFAAWTASGYPVTTEPPPNVPPGDLRANVRDETVVDAAYLLQHLRSQRMIVLDARGADRFAGKNETVDPVAGHIPGARNRPFRENFTADGRLKSDERLRSEFVKSGIDPQRTVHQCGSGISACVNVLAMERAGLTGSKLYAGSWSEWIADPSRPIEGDA